MEYEVVNEFTLKFKIPSFVTAESAEAAADKALDAACKVLEEQAEALGGSAGDLDPKQQFVSRVG